MTKGEQNGLTNDAHLVKVAPISSTFTWADVKYGVGTGKKEKQILKGVSGSLGGGKTCAIIGPSGAAKPRCSTCSPTASTTREKLSVSRASSSSTTSPSVALRCASGLHVAATRTLAPPRHHATALAALAALATSSSQSHACMLHCCDRRTSCSKTC